MWPFHHSGFRIENLFQVAHDLIASEYPIRLTWVWWFYVIVWMRFSRKAKGNITTATNDGPLKWSGPRSSYLSYSEGAFIIGLATSRGPIPLRRHLDRCLDRVPVSKDFSAVSASPKGFNNVTPKP